MFGELSDVELQRSFADLGFVTVSTRITELLRQALRAAWISDVTILIEGETGTGKQVLAHAIHKLDPKRCSFPLVTLHCGSVTETLAESELFGHRRGAFSGAVTNRLGLFRAAHLGALFMDDVNDLPLPLQAKLLDVLQRGRVRPIGCDKEFNVDVRLMAASNQPLSSLLEQKRFRYDLYHRLNVVKFTLPPLRERTEDLPNLLLTLAQRHSVLYHPIVSIEPGLVRLLELKPFLGNIRELENAVQRMLFLKVEGSSLGLMDWQAQAESENGDPQQDLLKEAATTLWKAISEQGLSYPEAVRQTEKKVLEIALSLGVKRREIAQRLGASERTLYYKLRLFGLGGHSASGPELKKAC